MRLRSYSSVGLILLRRNYSESDRILVIFSKHFGKLSLLAKGVRKLKSRKRSSVEIFNYIKFSAARGRGIDILTETEIIDSFGQIRKNLKKMTVAYFFVEVLDQLTRDEEKNSELLDLIYRYLSTISESKSLKNLKEEFIYEILVNLGFWPKGRDLKYPDRVLEQIVERKLNTPAVAKKLLL